MGLILDKRCRAPRPNVKRVGCFRSDGSIYNYPGSLRVYFLVKKFPQQSTAPGAPPVAMYVRGFRIRSSVPPLTRTHRLCAVVSYSCFG